MYLPNPPISVNSHQDIILHIPVVHQWQETRNGVEAVRLQKRMLGTRSKTGVAPVDLFLDLLGHRAVLLLQQMPGASHHAQPFRDRDFLIARSRIIIQRCDATFDFVERKIAAVYGGSNDAPLQIGLVIPVQRTGGYRQCQTPWNRRRLLPLSG